MRIVIVGGGISGLAAAWAVARSEPRADVLVLEASDRVGGKLRLAEVAGVTVDVGAEAMLARRPEGLDLIHDIGLGAELISPLTTSARIFAGGVAHPLPARTVMGVPGDLTSLRESKLLNDAELALVEGEPALQPLPPLTEDLPVADLIGARLGPAVVDRLVEPLLGGVYAGRAGQLSTQATVPALFGQLANGGSLVQAARSIVDATPSSDTPVFASLTGGGLGRLPEAMAGAGRYAVRTGVTARSIRRNSSGFSLECGPVPLTERIEADGVIVAVPAPKAGRLLTELTPAAAAGLNAIETASVAIVTLAFRSVHLPAGSGLLVGARENVAVKGVTISSQKWPIDAPGLTVLRASIGRIGEAQVLQRDDADLIRLARRDLRTLLGVDVEPVDAIVTRWGGGLPQYGVGHVTRVRRIREAVAAVPGLGICGAAFDGVGIPACIAAARLAADQVIAALRARGQ